MWCNHWPRRHWLLQLFKTSSVLIGSTNKLAPGWGSFFFVWGAKYITNKSRTWLSEPQCLYNEYTSSPAASVCLCAPRLWARFHSWWSQAPLIVMLTSRPVLPVAYRGIWTCLRHQLSCYFTPVWSWMLNAGGSWLSLRKHDVKQRPTLPKVNHSSRGQPQPLRVLQPGGLL